MLRACLSALFAGALYLLTTVSSGSPVADPSFRPAPRMDQSCKPQAAVAVTLGQGESSAGSRVDLEWSIQPGRGMSHLEWALQLPDDSVFLEGERSGLAAAEEGSLTAGMTSVSMPEDGRFRNARLIVSGSFLGSDETGATFEEAFEVVTHLSWGEPDTVAPAVLSPESISGEMTTFIALPTMHREGR